MSHVGIVGATTDSFILFENGVRRNRLVLPRSIEWGAPTITGIGTSSSKGL
jgi:hypothetical protein